MPNRLKIAMDFGTDQLRAESRIAGVLTLGLAPRRPGPQPEGRRRARPLAGPHARSSASRSTSSTTPRASTRPSGRRSSRAASTRRARPAIDAAVAAEAVAPGKLRADLTTRVFEPGGAFSIDRFSIPYSPYERYVGLRTPKGDKTRGMLLTDTKHRLDVALVDPDGAPARRRRGGGEALQGGLALVVGAGRGRPRRLGRRERPHAARSPASSR